MQRASATSRLACLLEAIAATVLLVVMTVVLVDVVGRNLINRPLPWGTELVELLLAVLIFSLYPVLAWRGNNITVDLITVRPSLQRVQKVLSASLGAGLFALIAYCMGRQAVRAAEFGEATPLLTVPVASVMWGLSIMAGITVLGFAVSLFASLSVRRGAALAELSAGPHSSPTHILE